MFSHWLHAAMLLFLSPGIAQNPWNGTWNLNKATMHAIPPALVIEKSGPHYTLKQGATYRFDCDGHDFSGPVSDSVRCEAARHGIKVELRRDGKLSRTWELRLHMDGITMTDIVTNVHDGVPPSIEHDEYRRPATGTVTLVGTWTGVRTTLEGSDTLQLRIHDGSLYFRDARDGESSEAQLDGTPGKFLGPGVPPRLTWSNVLENEHRIVGHALKDGKQLNTDVFELSLDGKSIKASQPGSPNQYEAVYLKQE